MLSTARDKHRLREAIRWVPNFPKPGINFCDLTNLHAIGDNWINLITRLVGLPHVRSMDFHHPIVGVEARGFIYGAALAYRTGNPFIAARKLAKLPPAGAIYRTESRNEYATETLAMDCTWLRNNRVIIVDDILATGGTASAVADLVTAAGGRVHAFVFVVELKDLDGRANLKHSFNRKGLRMPPINSLFKLSVPPLEQKNSHLESVHVVTP